MKIAMHDVVHHTAAELASTIAHFILKFIVDDFQTNMLCIKSTHVYRKSSYVIQNGYIQNNEWTKN